MCRLEREEEARDRTRRGEGQKDRRIGEELAHNLETKSEVTYF